MAIPNYIIHLYLLTREIGKKKGKTLFLYDSAINIRIISYRLTKKEKKGKEKGKKGKNLFLFVCMILLLIYMCLCLVIKMNCMYTCWVDCFMFYVNCFLMFHLVVGEDLYRHSLLSNHIDLSIKYLKWNDVHVSSGMSVSVDISVDMTPWNPWSCSHVSVNMIHGVVHVSSGMSIIADLASLDVCTIYCIPETGTDLYVV